MQPSASVAVGINGPITSGTAFKNVAYSMTRKLASVRPRRINTPDSQPPAIVPTVPQTSISVPKYRPTSPGVMP